MEKGLKLKKELASYILKKSVDIVPDSKTNSGKTNLQKGSKLYHISGIPFQKQKSQLYVIYDPKDIDIYEAYLGAKLKRTGYKPREVVLEISTNITAPSSKQQYGFFLDFLKDERHDIIKDITDWADSKGKTPKIKTVPDIYDSFINSLEKESKFREKFYTMLKGCGYNAVLDEHDITGSWMQSNKPLIIMDSFNDVGKVNISNLTTQDIKNAFTRLGY